jgi:hypothetical protein
VGRASPVVYLFTLKVGVSLGRRLHRLAGCCFRVLFGHQTDRRGYLKAGSLEPVILSLKSRQAQTNGDGEGGLNTKSGLCRPATRSCRSPPSLLSPMGSLDRRPTNNVRDNIVQPGTVRLSGQATARR